MQTPVVWSCSLVPRPCAFVACSTKFAALRVRRLQYEIREFRTANDERAGPGNEANGLEHAQLQTINVSSRDGVWAVVSSSRASHFDRVSNGIMTLEPTSLQLKERFLRFWHLLYSIRQMPRSCWAPMPLFHRRVEFSGLLSRKWKGSRPLLSFYSLPHPASSLQLYRVFVPCTMAVHVAARVCSLYGGDSCAARCRDN